MSEDAVHVTEQDTAAVVHMDDGKVNALSLAFLDELAEGLDEALDTDQPVVMTGNGKAFSAGLDLQEVPTLEEEGLRDLFSRFERVLVPILTAPVPVTAALDGFAIAGGAIIALSCDYRVAAPTAEVGATELNVGIPFPPPDLQLFSERLPQSTVRRTIMNPQRCHGEKALKLGWVDELDEDPLGAALDASRRLGGTNPAAFADMKRQLNEGIVGTWSSFDEADQEAYVDLLTSKTTQQAILEGIENVLG